MKAKIICKKYVILAIWIYKRTRKSTQAKLKSKHSQITVLRTREKISWRKKKRQNSFSLHLSLYPLPSPPPPTPPQLPRGTEIWVGALTRSSADNATNITEPGAVGGNPCQGEKQLIRSIAPISMLAQGWRCCSSSTAREELLFNYYRIQGLVWRPRCSRVLSVLLFRSGLYVFFLLLSVNSIVVVIN